MNDNGCPPTSFQHVGRHRRCDDGHEGVHLICEAKNHSIAGLHLRDRKRMKGQKERAGRVRGQVRHFIVGSKFDAVHDAAILIEVDQIVGGETRNGGHVFERLEPERGLGVRRQAFDENLDGFERIQAGIDDRDARGENIFAGFVVDAIFPSRHWSSIGYKRRAHASAGAQAQSRKASRVEQR